MGFCVPKSIDPAIVGPLFCAGLTVFSPLVRNKVTKGMRVGVIGVGGLGHLAVQFAHALGAEVTAISQSSRKKEDTVKMGAKHFIVTTEEGWVSKSARSLDLTICTSFSKEIPLAQYISLLDVGGT